MFIIRKKNDEIRKQNVNKKKSLIFIVNALNIIFIKRRTRCLILKNEIFT